MTALCIGILILLVILFAEIRWVHVIIPRQEAEEHKRMEAEWREKDRRMREEDAKRREKWNG